MKSEHNVPQVRFKGFTDAWEQREFGEVFVEYSEKNHEELPPLTIIQGKGTILREESDRNLIYDKSGLKNYKLVNESDFILHLRSFEGGLEVANSRGIVSPAYHIFHGENVDSRFYYPFFRSKYFISVLLKPHVYGIRDGKSIDVEGMKSIEIPCPTMEEQQAIGDYFTQLDKVITLHQRKCDTLQKLKKSMLQKMFPKNGRLYPEIRFAGFTDAWEQRKLSDMFTERNEQYPMSEDYPLMAFIANVGVAPKGERYDRSALVNDEAGKKYKRTEKGDFIYSSNNLETGSIGLNNYGNACISPVYSIFKSKNNADSDFLGRMLLRKEFIYQMVQYRQGVVYGQWKIHESDFLNLDISVPSLKEQQQIGSYFRNLDNLITLHQRKLETLKKLKKSMLQKMFI